MEREDRYLIIKRADIDNHLTPDNKHQLLELAGLAAEGRRNDGKPPLQAVVVEHDWPEYERVWAMLESRINADQYEFNLTAEQLIGLEGCSESDCYDQIKNCVMVTLPKPPELRVIFKDRRPPKIITDYKDMLTILDRLVAIKITQPTLREDIIRRYKKATELD